jgi:glutaredoxin/glutathione-dependent peroxiredoxin
MGAISRYGVTIALGPAGTGKTYLAVSAAVTVLEDCEVERIVLTRPVVEAGERLGYLPGDIAEKRALYLRPLNDTLSEGFGGRRVKQLTPKGVKKVTTDEIFGGKKIVLFAVPGAFTPACSQRHLPGFDERAADIEAKGVDEIACVAVNDAFVMGACGRDQKTEGKVRMLADGSGDFVRALGLELDLSKGGLGIRSQRYSMLVDNGVVKSLNIEKQPGQVDVSGAEAMLRAL